MALKLSDLSPEVKRELASACTRAAVPVVQIATRHHFDKKMLEKRKEVDVEVAEKRADGVAKMAAASGGGAATQSIPQNRHVDVYEQLDELRRETSCGFCANAAAGLQNAPQQEAARGLQELRTYQDEVERLKRADATDQEIDRTIDDLLAGWEVVPRYLGGAAAQAVDGQPR